LSKIARKLKELRMPRVSQFQPSTAVIMILLMGFSVFILGGGVYDIMEQPSNEIFFFPGMSGQFLNESLIFMLFLVMGMVGGFLAFRSTRYTYRPREAKMFLLIGLALLVVSFLGTEIILSLKGL
jgi:predicted benzoate:H+ symporter BenE